MRLTLHRPNNSLVAELGAWGAWISSCLFRLLRFYG